VSDKVNLDILSQDESLEDSANLPDPDIIAAEIDSQNSLLLTLRACVYVARSHELHCRRPPSRDKAFKGEL